MATRARYASRLWAVPAIVGWHVLTYFAVTRIIDRMPAAWIRNLETPLDRRIPYLPWTWPFYWAVYPFVVLGGAVALMRLETRGFQLAVRGYVVLILTCAVVQIALPAPAPWPDEPSAPQRLMHSSWLMRPWATFPSMHVALATFTAVLWWDSFRHGLHRAGAGIMTVLIGASTLTLKEHVLPDAIGGALAGGVAGFWWWRRALREPGWPPR
jgi:PAP2 superfamily protein